jgi:hypothetical protein
LDFCSLQHTKDRRSTCRGVSTLRYVPPSGFGYPLDGLLPPSPCRPCFVPAALMGFTLRSLPLSRGIQPFPAGRTHMPFLLPLPLSPKRQPVGASRGSWALTLARVPSEPNTLLTPRLLVTPLGFSPSRALRRQPRSGFHPNSSHALLRATRKRITQTAPQSINRLSLGLTRRRWRTNDLGRGDPLRVSAPACS